MNVPTAQLDYPEAPAADKPSMQICFRCYAYAIARHAYVAECIDLDIRVEETSLDRAVRSLNDAVEGYLSVALDGDRSGLIPRRSPVSRRLLYHYRVLVSRLMEKLLPRKRAGRLKQFELGRPSPCY